MQKPRRKRPRFMAWLATEPGWDFHSQVTEALGDDPMATPTGYDPRARTHHFRLSGSLGEGTLIEGMPERIAGTTTSYDVTFVQRRWGIHGIGTFTLTLSLRRGPGKVSDDRLGWTFEYDQLTLPVELAPDEAARALFPCSLCEKVAGGLIHVPAGTPLVGIDPRDDEAHVTRIGVLFDETVSYYTDGIPLAMETARVAIREFDPSLIATMVGEWAPFWCAECSASYCADHWRGDPPTCPRSHARHRG